MARGSMPIGLERMGDALAVKNVEAGGEQRQLAIGDLYGGPGLTAALGVPVLAGRVLAADDAVGRGGMPPVLITVSLARTLWPAGDPIGQIVLVGRGFRELAKARFPVSAEGKNYYDVAYERAVSPSRSHT